MSEAPLYQGVSGYELGEDELRPSPVEVVEPLVAAVLKYLEAVWGQDVSDCERALR